MLWDPTWDENKEYLAYIKSQRGKALTDEDYKAQQVINVLEDWFWAIENGVAHLRMPDVFSPMYTESFVNDFIKELDDFCEDEISRNVNYWQNYGTKDKGVPIDTGFQFRRLQGPSRLAFVQDVLKRTSQIYS